MTTMRARVIEKWGSEPVLKDVPVPEPGPGEVLVRVGACSVGLTVLNIINGDLTSSAPEHLPRIPGHEIAGQITSVGPGVEGLAAGDRIVTYFYLTCGACDRCRRGQEPLCRNFRGFLGAHVDGGYAEYVRVPARNCFLLPGEIDDVTATAIPDAILTPLHVCRSRARITPEDRVVILGAGGGVGIHLVQMARLFGAEVWGVDVASDKAETILDQGAVGYADFGDTAPEAMRERAGEASVVVDLVGRPETLVWSSEVLGTGGRLILLTTFRDISTTIVPRELVLKEQTIVGSRYASHYELGLAIRMVQAGRVRAVVTDTASLEDVPRLHEKLRAGTLIGRAALVNG